MALQAHRPGPEAGAGFGTPAKDPRICNYWKKGYCRNGAACRFTHADVAGDPPGRAPIAGPGVPAAAGAPAPVVAPAPAGERYPGAPASRAREPSGAREGRDKMIVRMPYRQIRPHEGVTFFAIEVEMKAGGPAHRVYRRYNDFLALSRTLGPSRATSSRGDPFPPKHWFGCSGPKLEARRAALEAWLISALSVRRLDWDEPLQHFLTSGAPAVDPAGGAAPRALPAAPPREQASQLFEVVVPAGAQLLAVSVPGAGPHGAEEVINFPVPQGIRPNTTLRLRYDHATRRLVQS